MDDNAEKGKEISDDSRQQPLRDTHVIARREATWQSPVLFSWAETKNINANGYTAQKHKFVGRRAQAFGKAMAERTKRVAKISKIKSIILY